MKKSILIVDDEEEIGQWIKEFFEEKGFKVFVATEGKVGCEYARRKQPALVLLDIRLPDQDGIVCLSEIKKTCPKTMVIMLTAVHDEDVARLAMKEGASDYLTKPFDLIDLYDRWVLPFFS